MHGIRGSSVSDEPRLLNVVSRAHGLTVEIPRELARSRRHSHEFSLILLHQSSEHGPQAALDAVVDRLALRLRLSDLLIRLSDDRLLIACPETNLAGARVLMTDIVGLARAEGVQVRASVASFPKSALTASELLRACEVDLDHDDTAPAAEGAAAAWGADALEVFTNEGSRR